jgi:5'-AMP-activated protein kinase catalytic alpha subunit
MDLKIVDFGLSNTYKRNEKLKTACGSPCYAAPEMLKGESYEPLGVDSWSAGVILFAMVCGYLPFEDNQNQSELYKKIIEGNY